MERYSTFMHAKTNIVKISVILNLIYVSKEMPIKIPASYLVNMTH